MIPSGIISRPNKSGVILAATALIIVGLSVVVSSACSNQNDQPSPTSSPTTTPLVAEPTKTFEVSPWTADPVIRHPPNLMRGGLLRLALPGEGGAADPHNTIAPTLLAWGTPLIYSRLFRFRFDEDAPLPNRLMECDLCESWRQTGPLSFEVRLRDNAFWQDIPPLNGRKVTAQDIELSMNRLADLEYKNSPLLQNVESIKALDDATIGITLKGFDAELLEKLAHGGASIVPSETANMPEGLVKTPQVGSGGWIAESWGRSFTRASRNTNYYESGRPYVDSIDIQFISDPFTRASALRIGITDITVTTKEEAESAGQDLHDITIKAVPLLGEGAETALNTLRSPLDSLAVRQAIFLAMDPEAYLENIWGSNGFISVGISPPDPSWSKQELFNGVFGDRDEALRILSTSGLSSTSPLVIKAGEFGDEHIEYASALAEAISSIGLATLVERITTRRFADEVWLGGDYDIFVGAPPPIIGTTARLFTTYHSEGQWNTTGHSDLELDRLIVEQAGEYDTLKRMQIFQDIEERIIAGRYRFNAASPYKWWVSRDCVQDLKPNDTLASNAFLTRVWLNNCN